MIKLPKFKGFLNPSKTKDQMELLRRVARDFGPANLRKQIITVKLKEMGKLAKKAHKNGQEPTIEDLTTGITPEWQQFFDTIGLDAPSFRVMAIDVLRVTKKELPKNRAK